MFWYGIIIGFAAGVVLATLCYTPLVDKVKTLEQRMIRDKDLIDESIKAMRCFERENENLKADLKHLYQRVPHEIYGKFYDDAPRTER